MELVVDSSQRYIPAENEPYMSDGQIAYFKERLMERKTELNRKISGTMGKIKSLESVHADILDRSNTYLDLEFEIRTFERYSILLDQVDRALKRIDDGSFGYCELTGSEIGLRRLEAIPFASMSIQALEAYEAGQKQQMMPARKFLFS